MIALALLSLAAMAASPYRPLPGDPVAERNAPGARQERIMPEARKGSCPRGKQVAGLPFARGQSFCSLDAYLAHLERQGAVDLPWWRQIRPGLYEHVKTMPGATREIATRAALMKRFGFTQ